MKKILTAMLCLCLLLVGCDKNAVVDTAVSDDISAPEQTAVKTDVHTTASLETTTAEVPATVPSETATTEITTATSKIHKQPTEFSIDNLSSVEDDFGGDVLYNADFDGDGKKETCTVKILGHGTQCYVEEIVIERENGEKITVEHPATAMGMHSNFYKFDSYDISFWDGVDHTEHVKYTLDMLDTAKEDLTPLRFGDIFDYSVIGDTLYFRGSLACGPSEVVGDIIYAYTYHGGELRVSHMWYEDYINAKTLDIGDLTMHDFLLVKPCKEDTTDVTLPDTEPLVVSRAILSNPEFLVFEKGLTYYVKLYSSPLSDAFSLSKYTLCLPEGYTDGEIISDSPGGGSGELGLAVHARKGESDVVLHYLFYSDYADKLKAPVEVREDKDSIFTPDAGTKLYEVYADSSSHHCVVRTYANADGEVLYYIIDLLDGQRIRYDKEEDAHPPMAKNIATFADVNFDGIDDFCLKLGNFGAQGVVLVRAYLGDGNGKYTLCESFEKISNPAIDTESKQICSTNRESASEHWYAKYEFKDGEFVNTAELLYNVADETIKIGENVLSAAEFTKAGSAWDLLNKKWSNIVTE